MNIWQWLKRVFDITIATIFIILSIPFWIVLAICIYIEDPGPIIFKQKRLGKDGKIFTIVKLRSMYVNNIPPLELGAIKHNHSLVTKVGHFMRRSKFDETPQFISVLLGDMSIVGPRPCLPDRMETMTAVEKKRLTMAPGLSGWAEVNGNVDLTWDEQVLLDLWYVNNWSFWLDLKVFIKTIKVVLFGSEINQTALDDARVLYTRLISKQQA